MNNNQILTELKNIVKPYTKNDEAFENFTEETNFITDLNINSANLVDIVLDVEEAFDIIIDNESMEKMINAKVALSVIQAKLDEK
ncbi:acyl carrier protein [Flavobacterium hydatis]|uniref:Acyl carrier protein n=1 Tax=Flavobacterium hydatis TaxID=991 RepID=A0A086AEG1_FLAHY|nr:acyl carrier protein [Flavobacterium hydatis]KFF15075.1 acyl carrier protein [Flavobacterium hydatis]OXA91975.1 acyl carrier protein [Flavobacterium hydatis]